MSRMILLRALQGCVEPPMVVPEDQEELVADHDAAVNEKPDLQEEDPQHTDEVCEDICANGSIPVVVDEVSGEGLCLGGAVDQVISFSSEDRHHAVIPVDANGDGLEDLFFLNQGAPNRFYIDNGTEFTEWAGQWRQNGHDAHWGDYDQDGDKDLLLGDDDGLWVYETDQGLLSSSPILLDDSFAVGAIAITSLGIYAGSYDGSNFRFYPWSQTADPLLASQTFGLRIEGISTKFMTLRWFAFRTLNKPHKL